MVQVTLLKQDERVRLDPDRLEPLFEELGDTGAEDIVCRALEALAARLGHAERSFREHRIEDMRKHTRGLIAIAEQIGMTLLARVAGDVIANIDAGDHIALGATFARLLRIGERSLCEIWEVQGAAY